jgi:hypothetical protein
MTWTYTLTYANGVKNVYASDITDTENWDAVNWGFDPKLVRVERTSDGQVVTVWARKTASGPDDETLPGWVPGALAAAGVVGAFALGMYLLGKEPKSFGAVQGA